MKARVTIVLPGILVILIALFLSSCSPVTLNSYVNPKGTEKTVSHLLVWGMFDKLEYRQPFEQYFTQYFNQKGIKSIGSLAILSPSRKYEYKDLESKFDSLGVDGILIFNYQNTDKNKDYVPPSTAMYPDYYYNYYSYYSWGYPIYSPGYSVVTTGGYWTTTTVVNLTANLYGNSKDDLLWSAQISITDPQFIDEAAIQIARSVYTDFLNKRLIGK
jgi:hypothetical protein